MIFFTEFEISLGSTEPQQKKNGMVEKEGRKEGTERKGKKEGREGKTHTWAKDSCPTHILPI